MESNTIQFPDSYNGDALAVAPVVDEIPTGFSFDMFEYDHRKELSENNYYKVYSNTDTNPFSFVAQPCPEEF